ncbi:MAG TPA: 2-phosphosulfolactate phosphatase [Chthoniobacterales bacterium]
MRIDVTLNPAEIGLLAGLDLSHTVCVVFDVLRATSTMTTALEHGVKAIYPAVSIDEAWALREKYPGALLGGERRGERIDGFDVGNSPLEHLQLAGKEIITTTTNGTIALRACAGAREVLAAALINIDAVANYLARTEPQRIRIVCAGTGSHFALEDAIGGGALIARLPHGKKLADAGQLLLQAWRAAEPDPAAAIAASKNGQRLQEIGRAEEVAWCSQVGVSGAVGRLDGDKLLPVTLPDVS